MSCSDFHYWRIRIWLSRFTQAREFTHSRNIFFIFTHSRRNNNYLLTGRKVTLYTPRRLEMFYFASDVGASKIIIRESPRCIKSLYSGQYVILFFFGNIVVVVVLLFKSLTATWSRDLHGPGFNFKKWLSIPVATEILLSPHPSFSRHNAQIPTCTHIAGK